MRAAPAVDYPVARSGFWRAAASLASALAGLAVAGWAASWQEAGTLITLAFTLPAAMACGALGWRWTSSPVANLRWDGERWHLRTRQGPAEPGEPEIALDWGAWVLLRWYGHPGGWRRLVPQCLPLTRHDQPSQWHALRVALHAAAPHGGRP